MRHAGSTHDEPAWAGSLLGAKIKAGGLMEPFCLFADAAYTGSNSVVTPFSGFPHTLLPTRVYVGLVHINSRSYLYQYMRPSCLVVRICTCFCIPELIFSFSICFILQLRTWSVLSANVKTIAAGMIVALVMSSTTSNQIQGSLLSGLSGCLSRDLVCCGGPCALPTDMCTRL